MEPFKVRGIQFDWDETDKQYVGVLNHQDFHLRILSGVSWKRYSGPEIYLYLSFYTINTMTDINVTLHDSYKEDYSYNMLVERALNQLNEELHKRLELAKSSVQQLTSAIVKTL